MSGTDTAAMVPGIYDFVVDGFGYNFLRTVDTSLPFRTQRALYSRSPTFVERSNVSNAYGDNAQDFFLTIRQRDWSLGEQQKYFRSGNDGRYYAGSNVDVSTPGQVRLAPAVSVATFAAAVRACSRDTNSQKIIAASATRLYTIDPAGTITDNGAHGLGATPSKFGICSDGLSNYITTLNAGTVGVRKWSGAAYSTFSATAADSLTFLNNTLYGYRSASGDLGKWDTAGTFTTIYPWKDAGGTAFNTGTAAAAAIEAYGGKILILFPYGMLGAAELWIYDGTGVSLLHVFPPNFLASDIEVLYGVAYISGSFFRATGTTSQYNRPAVHFYDGSTIGLLWQANDYNTTTTSDTFGGPHPAIVASNGKLVFTDDTMSTLLAYNPATGGVSTIGSFSAGGSDARMAATGWLFLHTRNQTGSYYTGNITFPSSSYVISSLIDFDSSLPKQFRGIKVEWDVAADGDGGSVDIAYQVGSLTGAWTTLQASAVSGTEYTLTNISGHAIAVKITINKGTSTAGPTLRNVSFRAAPQLQSYNLRDFVLDCSGRDGKSPVMRNDGTPQNLDGLAQVTNLNAFIASTSPVAISDRFATFTGVAEPDQCEIIEIRPEEYIVRIRAREV